MLFAQSVDARLASLAKAADQFVKDHKSDGMEAFVVLLAQDAKANRQKLQTLAKEEEISIPLTLCNPPGPGSYNLHEKADATALVTKHNKVKARFAFAGAAEETEAAEVLEAAKEALN